MKGKFVVEQVRGGQVIDRQEFPNGATTLGINHLLDVAFAGQTQVSGWYIGLIDGAVTPTLAASDSPASHPGWVEIEEYNESTRGEWAPSLAANGEITTSTAVEFTMSEAVDVAGVFLISESTKGGNTGVLYSTGLFDTVRNYAVDDVARINYVVSHTPS